MTLIDIQDRLGPPQEEISVKGIQNWVEPDWWGSRVLQIVSVDPRKLNEKPIAAIYIVYIVGWNDPVHRENLFTISTRGKN